MKITINIVSINLRSFGDKLFSPLISEMAFILTFYFDSFPDVLFTLPTRLSIPHATDCVRLLQRDLSVCQR